MANCGSKLEEVTRRSNRIDALQNIKNKQISLRWRRTKIIATVGPATDTAKGIQQLLSAGVNVFRLNMSHGTHVHHQRVFKRIRNCSKKIDAHVAILMDLCGPKIRVGLFENGSIELKKNSRVTVSCEKGTGGEGLIVSQYKKLYKDVKPGDRILLDDGNMECIVESVTGKNIQCRVIYGGSLKDNKGINLPDSVVSESSFTAKDKRDVELAMALGADFVALSFVRNAKDVKNLKRYMRKTGREIPVIAKIEKPEAVTNIDEIIKEAYGIMIARGDLGIEIAAEKVPLIQKDIINKSRINNRPVIVATQMMESMITNARPTRAEVGDVASAAMTSTDAVMLSAETAVGKYPFKAVRMMDKILREIEQDQWSKRKFGDQLKVSTDVPSSRKAVANAACSLVRELQLQGLFVPTDSGHTAAVLSASRPLSPLLGISENIEVCQKISLHWGVIPFLAKREKVRDWRMLSKDICKRCKLTRTGHRILLVSGFNDDNNLNEPVLKIMNVKLEDH